MKTVIVSLINNLRRSPSHKYFLLVVWGIRGLHCIGIVCFLLSWHAKIKVPNFVVVLWTLYICQFSRPATRLIFNSGYCSKHLIKMIVESQKPENRMLIKTSCWNELGWRDKLDRKTKRKLIKQEVTKKQNRNQNFRQAIRNIVSCSGIFIIKIYNNFLYSEPNKSTSSTTKKCE